MKRPGYLYLSFFHGQGVGIRLCQQNLSAPDIELYIPVMGEAGTFLLWLECDGWSLCLWGHYARL